MLCCAVLCCSKDQSLRLRLRLCRRSGDHFLVTLRPFKATPARLVIEERVTRLPRREGEVEQVMHMRCACAVLC